MPGISGLALYLPPYRVNLADWCEWNDQPWSKIEKVIGRSFRMRGPQQSVYTIAANAVWRLIEAYDIDPQSVGYLALGTESSSDNAAGAVIVKGMLDDALVDHGHKPLSRACEVPEYKHACLGGVYAMKGALRYLAADGANNKAIVVCADIAEYERGSTGEPTQGAGAVAMLLEAKPAMLEVDLAHAGSDSDYRIADFRKPFARFRGQAPRADGQMQDLPVFNGRYSTSCYVDATRHAINNMLEKYNGRRADYFHAVDHVFMHRPYHRMPSAGWAMAYLFALADGDADCRRELRAYCERAGVDAAEVLSELSDAAPDMRERVASGTCGDDAFPQAADLLRFLRKTEFWDKLVADKLTLGSERMCDLGNLYTAALPAWLAAGLVEARNDGSELLAHQQWLTLGYGSGDAAEALPMSVVPGWQKAAERINFDSALGTPVDLTEAQYIALHDGQTVDFEPVPAKDEFVVARIGNTHTADFCDKGIEYYRFVPAEPFDAMKAAAV